MSRAVRLCARCGAKNRPQWRHCLRCRAALDKDVERAPRRLNRRAFGWVGGGFALAAALLMALPGGVAPPETEPAGRPVVSPREAVLELAPQAPARQAAEPVLQPATAEDYARAGEAAYAQGNLAVALSAFESATASHPQDPDARNNLGQILVRLGRPVDALPHLEAAVAATPDKWAYRFNLARARTLMGDWAGAVDDYKRAAQLFPDDHVTLYNLGRALQKLGDHQQASQALERAVQLEPEDPSFLLTLAASYEKLSRLPDALNAYRDYLTREPAAREATAIRARIKRLESVATPSGEPEVTSDTPDL